MATPEEHSHLEKAGNHGDVLKHVVLIQAIKAQQKAHPEGIIFVDTHCGPGSYNLGEQVRNASRARLCVLPSLYRHAHMSFLFVFFFFHHV